jgi:hypothetical protein
MHRDDAFVRLCTQVERGHREFQFHPLTLLQIQQCNSRRSTIARTRGSRMKMSMKILAATVFAAASAGAMAAGLEGDSFTYQYYCPSLSQAYGAAGNYVVGSGVEVTALGGGYGSIDVSANQITIDFSYSAQWAKTNFNGFMLSNFPTNSITSVTVDGATTDGSFSSSFISFTNDSISVNWQGMPFHAGQTIVLDVGTAAPVPEAGNLAMMAAGLALFAGIARRRRVR